MTVVFLVRNVTLRGCPPIVEGKGSWIMLLVVPPAYSNIPLAIAVCFGVVFSHG